MPQIEKRPTTKRARSAVDAFKQHAVANFLGIRVLSITRRRVTGEMTITDSHINRNGRVGGGLIMAFADILGACGTVKYLPPGARTTTVESKTNFFAGGEGPVLRAVSIPLHIGRTTMVWQTTVSNADKRRVAVVTQTQFVIPAAPSQDHAPLPASARAPARQATRRGRRNK